MPPVRKKLFYFQFYPGKIFYNSKYTTTFVCLSQAKALKETEGTLNNKLYYFLCRIKLLVEKFLHLQFVEFR